MVIILRSWYAAAAAAAEEELICYLLLLLNLMTGGRGKFANVEYIYVTDSSTYLKNGFPASARW